jgi:hypothetical protein
VVIGLFLLALQADSFEGLFRSEPGTVWTYRRRENNSESRLILTLLRKEPGCLSFDEKDVRDGRADPRATTTVLAIREGFLVLERRVDDDPPSTLRLLKIGSKEGERWEGGRRLKDDGTTIGAEVDRSEFRLSPEKGILRIDASGKSTVLLDIVKPACTPISLAGKYNASLTKAWHPSTVVESEFNDLSSLPRGVQTMDGTPFDVRGVLQLAGQIARSFPEKVEGIGVGTCAARLHFLHATGWNGPPGTRIASFVIHFKDGTSAEMPVVSEEDVSDWWQYPQRRFSGKRGKAVWIGSNPACRSLGACLKLYKSTWENPKPSVEIERVDYGSQVTAAAPFLIAITAEGR